MTVAKRDRIACQGTKRVITWKGVVGAENRKERERERDGGKRGEKKNWKTEARRKGSRGGIPETDQGKERNIAFSVYSCAFLHVSVPMGRGSHHASPRFSELLRSLFPFLNSRATLPATVLHSYAIPWCSLHIYHHP